MPDSGDIQLPEPPDEGPDPSSGATRSLVEDVEALIADARTYLDAELSYQKSRAAFVGENIKRIIVFGVGAALLGLFAFGALTIGLIIALTPLVTAWGATAIVVGLMLLVVWLMLRGAANSWGEIMAAINDGDDTDEEEQA